MPAQTYPQEPRWPAFVAMFAAASLFWALPDQLSVGPSWLLLATIFVLLIPMAVSDYRGDYKVARILAFVANGLITGAMIAALALMVSAEALAAATAQPAQGRAVRFPGALETVARAQARRLSQYR